MGVREFLQLPDGVQFANKYVQQIITSWLGIAGDETDAQLCGVPLRQTSVKDDTLFALDARNRVTPGNHIRATHSSGTPTLFTVLDDGAHFNSSPSGVFAVGMIMQWFGAAADCPTGWAICDGTNGTPDLRDRFVIGAGSTYALGATAGNATVDVSHVHTGPSHLHGATTGADGTGATSSDGSGSTSSDGTGNTGNAGTGSTSSDGTGSTSSDGSGNTSGPTGTSTRDDGTGSSFTYANGSHTHAGPSHSHSGPSHSHTGPSHNHSGPSHSHSGPAHTHTGPSHAHTISADGTGDTSSSGSAVLSIIPPFSALYYIMRTAA